MHAVKACMHMHTWPLQQASPLGCCCSVATGITFNHLNWNLTPQRCFSPKHAWSVLTVSVSGRGLSLILLAGACFLRMLFLLLWQAVRHLNALRCYTRTLPLSDPEPKRVSEGFERLQFFGGKVRRVGPRTHGAAAGGRVTGCRLRPRLTQQGRGPQHQANAVRPCMGVSV